LAEWSLRPFLIRHLKNLKIAELFINYVSNQTLHSSKGSTLVELDRTAALLYPIECRVSTEIPKAVAVTPRHSLRKAHDPADQAETETTHIND
jgi:hypothetical protein